MAGLQIFFWRNITRKFTHYPLVSLCAEYVWPVCRQLQPVQTPYCVYILACHLLLKGALPYIIPYIYFSWGMHFEILNSVFINRQTLHKCLVTITLQATWYPLRAATVQADWTAYGVASLSNVFLFFTYISHPNCQKKRPVGALVTVPPASA